MAGLSVACMLVLFTSIDARAATPATDSACRKMAIIVPSTHMDIDFTGLVTDCYALYDTFIVQAIHLAEKDPRIAYTIEHTSAIKHFLQTHPQLRKRLMEKLKAGQLEIGCSWTSPHYADLGQELMLREFAYAKHFLRTELGYESIIAKNGELSDPVPQMAQVMSKCGIALFQSCKVDQNPLLTTTFAYVGLDGSEVLFHPYNYTFRGRLSGIYNNDRDILRFMLMDRRMDLSVQYVDGGGDDAMPDIPALIAACSSWDSSGDSKSIGCSIITSTMTRFVKEYTARVAAGRIDPPQRGTGFTQHGEQLYYQWGWTKYYDRAIAEQALLRAEKLSAVLDITGIRPYPSKTLDSCWENLMQVSTHNWGYQKRKGDTLLPPLAAWAREQGERISIAALKDMTRSVKTGNKGIPVIVVNLSNGTRIDVATAEVEMPESMVPAIIGSSGRLVPCQEITAVRGSRRGCKISKLVFVASKMPSFGWKTYYVTDSARAGRPSMEDTVQWNPDSTFENAYYKVKCDNKGIRSIFDKANRREMVGQNGIRVWEHGYGILGIPTFKAEYMDRKTGSAPLAFTSARLEKGPVRAGVSLVGRAVELNVHVYAGVPRIDIQVVPITPFPNILYALHADVNCDDHSCSMRVGMQYGSVEYPHEPVWRGTATAEGWSKAVQGLCAWTGLYNEKWHAPLEDCVSAKAACASWIDVHDNASYGITISGERPSNLWICDKEDRSIIKKSLFLGDSGLMPECFSIRGHAGTWKQSNAPLFGEQTMNPLLAVQAKSGKGLLPEEASCLTIEPSGSIALTAFKKAWNREGYIVRFYETIDSITKASITVQIPGVRCDIFTSGPAEDGGAMLQQIAGQTAVKDIRGFGIETIRLKKR
ncbi:MAG: hypothetical protein A2248_00260 [Candidatus Raymondbacteria bacterium RIFOXYA2_FULL_49_16]|nr:MAG: hypothetical protein A2248_00260 [Candidatus Raymondbacteria bacterium RIFOXYA2_FULL_49_16]OGJ96177.1 MAG: hypothetical protein A2453_05610 [Candidatus Raymondbacteria bacterium RIFOXYC2_FULL_50_21]OGP41270.1 MAG: hypothetical protein A2324_16750 [Candidatus Raymondbacteria bacterium RIFOXYB2_FULL_49_35]